MRPWVLVPVPPCGVRWPPGRCAPLGNPQLPALLPRTASGRHVLDVASLLRMWVFGTDSEVDPHRLAEVLAAYGDSRVLSDEETASLPSAILLVTAADACDHLLRTFNRDPGSMRPHESAAVARFLGLSGSEDWRQAIR